MSTSDILKQKLSEVFGGSDWKRISKFKNEHGEDVCVFVDSNDTHLTVRTLINTAHLFNTFAVRNDQSGQEHVLSFASTWTSLVCQSDYPLSNYIYTIRCEEIDGHWQLNFITYEAKEEASEEETPPYPLLTKLLNDNFSMKWDIGAAENYHQISSSNKLDKSQCQELAAQLAAVLNQAGMQQEKEPYVEDGYAYITPAQDASGIEKLPKPQTPRSGK